MACRELLQDIRSLMSPLLYREPSSLNAFTKSHLQASDFVSLYHDSHLRCLPLLRDYHDPIRCSPIMQACWLSCAHYTVIFLQQASARDPGPIWQATLKDSGSIWIS